MCAPRNAAGEDELLLDYDCEEDMKYYIVGAGCGDPGLITVKGMELLEKVDVLIYAGRL